MSAKNSELAKLLTEALGREMTAEQKEAQRLSFVYGTTKIENDAITRDTVQKAAQEVASEKKNR